MKKRILGAALFVLVSFTYASASTLVSSNGQPRVMRNIVSTQLPAALLSDLKNDYKDYWITDCYEKGKKNKEDYFITLENADQTVELKGSDKSAWEVVSTTVKE